jgi:hypothetical protein
MNEKRAQALLMDGDTVIRITDDPGCMYIVQPVFSKHGRCCCTKPAIKIGQFCHWKFKRTSETGPGGEAIYKILPRASAVKLTIPSWARVIP